MNNLESLNQLAELYPTFSVHHYNLQHVSSLRTTIQQMTQRNPDYYGDNFELLRSFFSKTSQPIDIALIMFSSLRFKEVLADYVENNNLLYYRPKSSHNIDCKKRLLVGQIHPERTLLLFDDDMDKGNAMREARDFFLSQGYSRESIYGYLFNGAVSNRGTPLLRQIDELLELAN